MLPRPHSTMLTVAVAATLLCMVGSAAITGLLSGAGEDVGKAEALETGAPCEACGVVESIQPRASGGDGAQDAPTLFEITVRMADGSTLSLTQRSQPAFAVGDPVRMHEGKLTAA